MPLYEYKCKCGFMFEDLKRVDESTAICKSCGKVANRQISRCATVVAGGTTNETVDMTVGRAANERWQSYTDKQSKRRSKATLTTVDAPKGADGKYRPVMALGSGQEKAKRAEYSTALKRHTEERSKKGLGQFSGVGAF